MAAFRSAMLLLLVLVPLSSQAAPQYKTNGGVVWEALSDPWDVTATSPQSVVRTLGSSLVRSITDAGYVHASGSTASSNPQNPPDLVDNQAFSTGFFRADDVVFTSTDPQATSAVVSANVIFEGYVRSVYTGCVSSSYVEVQIAIGGVGAVWGRIDYDDILPYGSSGILSGYPNDGSPSVIVVGPGTVSLGVPTTISLQVGGNSDCSFCDIGSTASHAGTLLPPTTSTPAAATLPGELSTRDAMVASAADLPVFNVPSGVTVNSPQAGIVDNHWVPNFASNTGVNLPSGVAAGLGPLTPNPASIRVSVPFRLPAASQVKLTVEDIQGRRVATLLDCDVPAGSHSVDWRTSNYRPGVYLVRLDVGGRQVGVRRAVITR